MTSSNVNDTTMTLNYQNHKRQQFEIFNNFFKTVLVAALFVSCFAATFSSDHTTLGIPSFYLAWTTIVMLRAMLGLSYTKTEAYTQFFLLVAFLPMTATAFTGWHDYYHGYIFSVLYVNALFCLRYLVHKRAAFRIAFLMLLAFAFFSFINTYEGGLRSTVVFGPNVLYRIAPFLALFCLGSLVFTTPPDKKAPRMAALLFMLFSAAVLIALSTGSRGAAVVLASLISLVLLFQWHSFSNIRGAHIFRIFTILTGSIALGFFLDAMRDIFWRTFYFNDLDSGFRFGALKTALDFLSQEKGLELIFGYGPINPYFSFYPHNLFVESLVYGGLLQGLFSVLLFISLTSCIIKSHNKDFLFLFPLLGISIGALFSGGIQYNFPVFSGGMYVLSYLLSTKIAIHPRNHSFTQYPDAPTRITRTTPKNGLA